LDRANAQDREGHEDQPELAVCLQQLIDVRRRLATVGTIHVVELRERDGAARISGDHRAGQLFDLGLDTHVDTMVGDRGAVVGHQGIEAVVGVRGG